MHSQVSVHPLTSRGNNNCIQTNINKIKCMLITSRQKLYTLNPMETLKLHIGTMLIENIVEHKVFAFNVYINITLHSRPGALVKQTAIKRLQTCTN